MKKRNRDKNKLKVIFESLTKHKLFILLFLLAAVLRYLYLQDDLVPFLFDHGKDSLAILHMIALGKLKFIGPWTSIPGLYFGPAWYYLLAPGFYLSSYNPASAAVTMTLLVLLQMYLVYRYFNLESATIVGFSGFWLMISKSAWNPFPMTLLSLLIVILLLKQLELKSLSTKLLIALAFTASLGFHFSSAFAIFYPLIVLVVLLRHSFWPTLKQLVLALLAFMLPFIPQILFELKNGFPQYHAVLNYFWSGSSQDKLTLAKVSDIIYRFYGENRNLVFEAVPGSKVGSLLLIVFLLFVIAGVYLIKKRSLQDKKLSNLAFITGVFVFLPMFGFLFLHFNLWYVYPIVPVVTVLLGSLVAKLDKQFSYLFILLYLITAFWRLGYFLKVEKPKFLLDSGFYPVKRKVIDYIRTDAAGRDFSVYTYKPDIYDFPYQYEFLAQGLKGEELPLEFAYEPDVVSYVKEKQDLLAKIDAMYGQRWRGKPKVIYYVVTENDDSELLTNWWGRQKYQEIVAERKFGDRLVVYTAKPLKE